GPVAVAVAAIDGEEVADDGDVAEVNAGGVDESDVGLPVPTGFSGHGESDVGAGETRSQDQLRALSADTCRKDMNVDAGQCPDAGGDIHPFAVHVRVGIDARRHVARLEPFDREPAAHWASACW